ncbi:ABC transporter ATP-binding protein [Pollutimonas bauzanensis]|uniref:Iron complex transport system ATP-binding protein n=1 Tax=Pollutimonas bauzanensis TaxID=658167 RepID=A0A1M5ZI68_9BURK|nr:ABC transporter ATP-binding protein [Pollutimonas bauzanensis]SHI23930.1 iron complex transport system ATP-binding protein [Pollutimonas bauzanensis]
MNPEPSRSTLQVGGLSCTLGANHVLRKLSLPALRGGQLVALLGRNGSGKSTLLRSIAGLVPARADTLMLDGEDLRPLGARARAAAIRYLPQSLPDFVHLTVTEAVLVALKARAAVSTAAAMQKAAAVLGDLGLEHLGSCFLDELSGGQKQLVGLAQALVHEPAVLLLDEPLASLDLNYQHHVMQMLSGLALARGLLIIIVLHDLNIALRYANAALLLHDGALLASGEPPAVITAPHLAQAFLVRARVERCSQGRSNVFVDDLIQL